MSDAREFFDMAALAEASYVLCLVRRICGSRIAPPVFLDTNLG